jgi:NitT/TauT family transport system ATP-binding protein
VSEILPRAAEKVLAFKSRMAREHPDVLARLVRAHARAADFVEEVGNRDEVAAILAAPNRIGVAPEVIRRTLDGRLKVSPDGATRTDANYLLIGRDGAGRPDPAQAAWLYAQMVRWGQAPLSDDMCRAAMGVFRPDLYDAAVGVAPAATGHTNGRIAAFAGPTFDPGNISAHLSSWRIGRVPVP